MNGHPLDLSGEKRMPFCSKNRIFFLLRTYGCSCGRVTSPYEEMLKIRTVQDTGCSGGIRTHGLRVMSPASDRTALRCDKIESTELLHPNKSFTINGGGFERPSIQRLSGFLPSLHALRLLAGDFYVVPKTPFFVSLQTL